MGQNHPRHDRHRRETLGRQEPHCHQDPHLRVEKHAARDHRPNVGSNPVTTTVVYDADDIPSDIEGFDVIRNKTGDTIAYQYQTARRRPDPDTWHPEIAARIWALSRVRTLNTPIADPTTGKNATTKEEHYA